MQKKLDVAISSADFIVDLLHRLDVSDPKEIVDQLRTEYGKSSLLGAVMACLDVAGTIVDRLPQETTP